jgi:hypothetical protein
MPPRICSFSRIKCPFFMPNILLFSRLNSHFSPKMRRIGPKSPQYGAFGAFCPFSRIKCPSIFPFFSTIKCSEECPAYIAGGNQDASPTVIRPKPIVDDGAHRDWLQ